MTRNCFNYIVKLEVYEFQGNSYIDCLSRQKRIQLLPEEEVRQAILYYFYNYSKIDFNKFCLKVEYNSLDIAFYLNYSFHNFNPSQSPIIIFELKRDYTNLFECVRQISKYMSRFNCKKGVLTNSSDILLLNAESELEVNKILISELENEFKDFKYDTSEDILNFTLAQTGNLDAFICLVEKFGRTSKFTFQCLDYSAPITCFYFQVINDYILFDFCYNLGKKQPKIKKSSFLNLISIHE